MNTKKQLYKFVGIFSAIIYLLIVVMQIFTVEDFKLLELAPGLLAILFTPAIYLIFAGLGEILDFIETSTNNIPDEQVKSEFEEDSEPVQMEINLDNENSNGFSQEDDNDKNVDEQQEINEEETVENTEEISKDETVDENHYEPVIKNGKIQCRYCGKYNSMKRTYCYLCAKKLKD